MIISAALQFTDEKICSLYVRMFLLAFVNAIKFFVLNQGQLNLLLIMRRTNLVNTYQFSVCPLHEVIHHCYELWDIDPLRSVKVMRSRS